MPEHLEITFFCFDETGRFGSVAKRIRKDCLFSQHEADAGSESLQADNLQEYRIFPIFNDKHISQITEQGENRQRSNLSYGVL